MSSDDSELDHEYNYDDFAKYETSQVLKRKIESLEKNLLDKDRSYREIKRKSQKLEAKVKILQIKNKVLQKQLGFERNHFGREKKALLSDSKMPVTESTNFSPKSTVDSHRGSPTPRVPIMGVTSLKRNPKSIVAKLEKAKDASNIYGVMFFETAALKAENEQLRQIIERLDNENGEIRRSLHRIRSLHRMTYKRLNEMDDEFIQVMKMFMDRFNTAREEYNVLHSLSDGKAVSSLNAKFIELVENNSGLVYENALMRLELQCVQKCINRNLFKKGPREWILRRLKSFAAESSSCNIGRKDNSAKLPEEAKSDVNLEINLNSLESSNSESSSRLNSVTSPPVLRVVSDTVTVNRVRSSPSVLVNL